MNHYEFTQAEIRHQPPWLLKLAVYAVLIPLGATVLALAVPLTLIPSRPYKYTKPDFSGKPDSAIWGAP